ncbi:Dienelactone hydrolase [Niveomyces insectorum RCEF 264]|uniref:Dienelactone hydrolase n=1 Tax=Niveomyces insectorum RCEF 264 TaxID=1081102 RepID=A0A167RJ99_9HYPO|nr:Dienelactone hydrolase [Niveomyces insectorum RCEF 264]
MASLPEQCCTLPPFTSDYTATGTYFTVAVPGQTDLRVYAAGPADATTTIVCIYDIFGLHPNTLQGADHLAATYRCRVVLPDFFRGETWPLDNMPPKEGRAVLSAWVQKRGNWDVIRPALLAVVDRVKADGATKLGAYGFCFGAKKLIQAMDEHLFASAVLVHPSFFVAEDGDAVQIPVALIPSQGEDPAVMNGFWERVQKKGGRITEKSIREDFLDMHHGFGAARSNWADERMAARARDCFAVMIKFFKNTL